MDDDLDIDFTVPEDNNMGNNSYNDNTEYEYAPSNNMQNALFGDSDLFEETKKQKERKVLVPLIICILCALISLGVLGVILYLTPSIMKIAGGMQTDNTAVVSTITEAETIAAEEEAVIEKPVIRHAEENEIVVLEKTVQPVVPETTTSQKDVPSIIRHLVKWGDTLWDLAGFYYRNPWLYKIISDANNLKNPDLIISGTYLTIPDR
ncbi:MAG: LysM peptidoglycan-binding domain-containing protein [Spirochaetaceae bacterium]|nr:LysM peptidoglycan-binding domain-containing protein [Spirochaetaceae bacterium]